MGCGYELDFVNDLYLGGIIPVFRFEARAQDFNLAPNQILVQGTVMGGLAAGQNAVQKITPIASGGAFKLIYGIQQTINIPYNATASVVQLSLESLNCIGSGNVMVSGPLGGPYIVTFQGTLGLQPIMLLSANVSSLNGLLFIVNTTDGLTAGTLKTYNENNADGSQIPRGILQYDCAVDNLGNITISTQGGVALPTGLGTVLAAPIFFCGTFNCSDIIGLDTNALTVSKWYLLKGNTISGIVRLP